MKNDRMVRRCVLICLVVCCILIHAVPMAAAPAEAPSIGLVLKIARLGETLDFIDGFYQTGDGTAPTGMLRALLFGTAWIDPTRAIVAGFDRKGDQPLMAALVPFRRPNSNFKNAYGAMERDSYYLLQLPPGRSAAVIPQTFESALAAAALQPPRTTVSASLRVRQLMEQNRGVVAAFLEQAVQAAGPAAPSPHPMALSPEEIKDMLTNIVGTLEQLETLMFGVDIHQEHFAVATEASAVAGSTLAGLFSRSARHAYLNAYQPDYPIVFRSGAYDVDGMMALLNACFGRLYAKMGIDFAQFTDISRHFTGEVAGGMTFGQEKTAFESVVVMRRENNTGAFLTKTYLPWILGYGEKMSQMMQQQLGTPVPPLFSRTADSSIDGRNVVGLRAMVPLISNAGGMATDNILAYEMRTTIRDNLLLIAPDDERLARLIRAAGSFSRGPVPDPFMQVDIDLGVYVAAVNAMLPDHLRRPGDIPPLGTLKVTMDMGAGSVRTETAVQTADLMRLAAYFTGAPQPVGLREEKPRAAAEIQSPETPAVDETNPAYWFDKGGLVATYGNDKAAVEYYKKAIALDPQKSEYYFNLGISCGELGRYAEAIEAVDRAIALNAEKGIYYYGRGRVYLLSGDREKALADFEIAAEKGNADAAAYLARQVR